MWDPHHLAEEGGEADADEDGVVADARAGQPAEQPAACAPQLLNRPGALHIPIRPCVCWVKRCIPYSMLFRID